MPEAGAKPEVKSEAKPEAKPEAKTEAKTEAKPELKSERGTGHKQWLLAISTAGHLVMDDSANVPNWPAVDASLPPDPIALPAPDADAFDTGYPVGGPGRLASGSGETVWPAAPKPGSPSSELPAPILEDIAVPVEKRQVVGEVLGLRPSAGVTGEY